MNFSFSERQLLEVRDQIEKGLLHPPVDNNYEVEIVLVDGSVFPHRGRITFTEPSYSEQTGTFLIRVSVENPTGVLRPGQYVRARLLGAVRPHAILVPQRSVQVGSRGKFVWVVDQEGTAQQRPVVDGTVTLQPGQQVKTKPYEPAGASVSATPATSR